ncbi:von Willebrand factor type A domain protein [Variovorax sp. PBL-H6]|uniref:VWA domain-containing protein n=1 Tax=Variovorax sp. PBL-H6 TaxID=434009 RepID=UPI0013178095|nr:VWA domain-containing protein [Variovorax sp. PBL-H6]VTU36998.1 von Willebrand factor type A domain protein [Variovorax sp. PBL-H6]
MIPRPSRLFQRSLAALLCAEFLLSACSATEIAPGIAHWPAPAPAPQPEAPIFPSAQWPAEVVARTAPNFQAPSATHCARPVQTWETPGRTAGQRDGATVMGGHGAGPFPLTRDERARRMSPGGASVGAVAAMTAPASPPAHAAKEALTDEAAVPRFIPPAPAPQPSQRPSPVQEIVTAGMVDDNADFADYLQFRQRTRVAHRDRDVSERYLLQVRNRRGDPVPDAEVAVQAATGATMWARTDTAGRVWLHPRAFDRSDSAIYEVAVRKSGQQGTAFLRRGQKSAVELVLNDLAAPQRARLDLVFLIDATGSMGDEIGKLKASLRSIANEVARLPSSPDTCFGLVAYRDHGDEFLVRGHDFTNDLGAFQSVLDALQADGGGDYPEAMSEALHEAVHRLSWRGTGATRMVVLLADAPPHLDYGGPQYDDDMMAALGKGIKVFSVGASGLDRQGEYIQRQIAQYTGGRFVFLTYREASHPGSGPGRETTHDVTNYSVQTLDRLIVRLVSEELAKLPRGG